MDNKSNLSNDQENVEELLDENDGPMLSVKTTKRKPRKVERQWKHEEIVNLILYVEQRPALWNAGHPEYKLVRLNTWTEVGKLVGGDITANDAKVKWSSLRTTFNTNLRKVRASKSGQSTNELFQPTWQYFHQLLFLEASVVQQSTQSTASMTLPSASTDQLILDELQSMAPQPILSATTIIPGTRKRRVDRQTPTSSLSPSPAPSMRMKELASEVLSKFNSDIHSVFGEYIANEMRTLTESQSTMARRLISRALNNFIDSLPSNEQTQSQGVNDNDSASATENINIILEDIPETKD